MYHFSFPRWKHLVVIAPLLLPFAGTAAQASAAPRSPGDVYAMTNALTGNSINAYDRSSRRTRLG